jgi:hypothetical protein
MHIVENVGKDPWYTVGGNVNSTTVLPQKIKTRAAMWEVGHGSSDRTPA